MFTKQKLLEDYENIKKDHDKNVELLERVQRIITASEGALAYIESLLAALESEEKAEHDKADRQE